MGNGWGVLLWGGVRKTEGSLSLECPKRTSKAFPPTPPSHSPASLAGWLGSRQAAHAPAPCPSCPESLGHLPPPPPQTLPEPHPCNSRQYTQHWLKQPNQDFIGNLKEMPSVVFPKIHFFFQIKLAENYNSRSFHLVQKTLPQTVLSTSACHRNMWDNLKCLFSIIQVMVNPPEKTEMEATEALPQGTHRQVREQRGGHKQRVWWSTAEVHVV